MTAIWDMHATVAHRLQANWDAEVAVRLKASLSTIYQAVRDRKEYQDWKVRWIIGHRGEPLLGVLGALLSREWTQADINEVYEITGGELHDFDHEDIPLNGKLTYGHHTEVILAKLPKKVRDTVPFSYSQFGLEG